MAGVDELNMSSQENEENAIEDSPLLMSDEVRNGVNYVLVQLDKDVEFVQEEEPAVAVPEEDQVMIKLEPGQEGEAVETFVKKKTKKSQGGRWNPNWSETQTEALWVFCCKWQSILQGNITQKLTKEVKMAKWEECAKHVSK